MALEIERRFLVQGNEWKALAGNAQHFRQGYLVTSIDKWTIRIRIMGETKAWLTLKSPARGISKHEFEYLIPFEDAESIWEKTTYKLTKRRYPLNINGGEWIVDCFEEDNSPLVIAEVELSSEEQKIQVPKWCFEEVTNKNKLSNAALAQTPIKNWDTDDLITIGLN